MPTVTLLSLMAQPNQNTEGPPKKKKKLVQESCPKHLRLGTNIPSTTSRGIQVSKDGVSVYTVSIPAMRLK